MISIGCVPHHLIGDITSPLSAYRVTGNTKSLMDVRSCFAAINCNQPARYRRAEFRGRCLSCRGCFNPYQIFVVETILRRAGIVSVASVAVGSGRANPPQYARARCRRSASIRPGSPPCRARGRGSRGRAAGPGSVFALICVPQSALFRRVLTENALKGPSVHVELSRRLGHVALRSLENALDVLPPELGRPTSSVHAL